MLTLLASVLVLAVTTVSGACPDGLSGLNCGLCASDASCAASSSSTPRCASTFAFVPTMRAKTYSCFLSPTLQAIFNDGAMSLGCTVANKTCTMAVYKNATGPMGPRAVDCTMDSCQFEGTTVSCANLECKCTALCSDLTKAVFETTMLHQQVKMTIDKDNVSTVAVTGSPLPLEGKCVASSCESAAVADALGLAPPPTGAPAAPTPAFSTALVIALTTVVAGSLAIALVACCFFSSYKVQLQRSAAALRAQGSLEDPLSMAPLTTSAAPGVGEKLEFVDITCQAMAPRRLWQRRPVMASTTILHQISGSFHRGQVVGLMGPSGSGKTTLLNALAGVANGTTVTTGQLSLDGMPLPAQYRRIAAYVHQDDTLLPTLTVRECIEYSAFLRLPARLSLVEKQTLVHRVLDELKLTHVADARVGSASVRGISGGERRRLSIGMELVTSPSILFLDEPTSGLDSATANSLVHVLHTLAKNGRMVVLSIHQPSTKAFLKLDKVLLLAKGKVMYHGPATAAGGYFARAGFACPEDDTVADHLLDVVSAPEAIDSLHQLWLAHHTTRLPSSSSSFIDSSVELLQDPSDAALVDTGKTEGRQRASRVLELQVLCVRSVRTLVRNRTLCLFHFILSGVLALVAGGIFSGLELNLAGFQNRMGAFYFVLTFFGFATLSSMDVFLTERTLFFKEASAGYYAPWSYFVSKASLDLVSLRVVPAVLFAAIFYYIMGLNAPIDRFLLFTATLVLFNVAAGSLSLLVSIVSPNVGVANLAATVVLLFMLLFGGFLLNVDTMPALVAPFQYLSLFKYAFEVLMTNELSGLLLNFDAPGYPVVPIYGHVFLKTLGMDVGRQVLDIGCLLAFIALLNVASYVALAMKVPSRVRLHMGPGRPLPVLAEPSAYHVKSHASSTVSLK